MWHEKCTVLLLFNYSVGLYAWSDRIAARR